MKERAISSELRVALERASTEASGPLVDVSGLATELGRHFARLGSIATEDTLEDEERRELEFAVNFKIPDALRSLRSAVDRLESLRAPVAELASRDQNEPDSEAPPQCPRRARLIRWKVPSVFGPRVAVPGAVVVMVVEALAVIESLVG